MKMCTLGDRKKTKVKNHTFNHIQYQNINKLLVGSFDISQCMY